MHFAVGLSLLTLLTGSKLIEKSEGGFILSVILVETAKRRFRSALSVMGEKLNMQTNYSTRLFIFHILVLLNS